MTLEFAYSPCPNDTYAFHAAREGLVGDVEFDVVHHDVETLNEKAFDCEFPVTKLSFGAFARVVDDYALLRSGAALGRGVGPVVVARDELDASDVSDADVDVVVPGELTTAHLLLRLRSPEFDAAGELRFDEVMPAVSRGQYDAGVVIHEGRFTYEDHGLRQVVDLGRWWEDETELPVPLGCIAVHRDVDRPELVERALRESVRHAFEDPDASREYVSEHSQEMSEDVVQRHIDTYVNDYTVDVGGEGLEAVEEVFERGRRRGVLPEVEDGVLAVDEG